MLIDLSSATPSFPFSSSGLLAIPLIGVFIAGWSFFKELLIKMYRLFVVTVNFNGDANTAIIYYLRTHYKRMPLSSFTVWSGSYYMRTRSKFETVPFLSFPNEPTIWWRKGKLLLTNNQNTVSYLRGTLNFKELAAESNRLYNAAKNSTMDDICTNGGEVQSSNRYYVVKLFGSIGDRTRHAGDHGDSRSTPQGGGLLGSRSGQGATPDIGTSGPSKDDILNMKLLWEPIGFKMEDIGLPLPPNPMQRLVLTDKAKDFVISCQRWITYKSWFNERGLTWKRGVLLYGPPGTGKTALVRALARDLNMPIVIFDLASMTNRDFTENWETAMKIAPAVMLFEDIDSIFEGRTNIATTGKNETGLTFSCFLNTLDGVDNSDGALIVITTNEISKIDEAIAGLGPDGVSSRPGRIDAILEMPKIGPDGQRELASKLLDGLPDRYWRDLIIEAMVTPAQFQEMCCKRAIELMNNDPEVAKAFSSSISDHSEPHDDNTAIYKLLAATLPPPLTGRGKSQAVPISSVRPSRPE